MSILTSKNTLPAAAGVALYNMIVFLKTAGWTVLGSGDGQSTYQNSGQTAGLGGGDPWNIFTTGASGNTGFGNNNAWVRLRQPGGSTREFIFQRVTATTILIRYTPAGFTLGGAANGTVPTGTNQQTILNSADLFGTFNRVSYWADNASPYGWGMVGWSAAGANTFAFVLDALISGSYPASDQDPYVIHCFANSANFGAYATYTLGTNMQSYFNYGTGSQAFTTTTPGWGFVGPGGVQINNGTQLPINPLTSKDDNLPLMYARYTGQAAPTGYRGISAYIQQTSITRANLSTQTVTTTSDRLVLGTFSTPWGTDGVSPLL